MSTAITTAVVTLARKNNLVVYELGPHFPSQIAKPAAIPVWDGLGAEDGYATAAFLAATQMMKLLDCPVIFKLRGEKAVIALKARILEPHPKLPPAIRAQLAEANLWLLKHSHSHRFEIE